MPDYCADSRSAARHHILTFKGSGSARGSRLGLQAWELISKSAEIRAEPKLTVSTPAKSTIWDRLAYLV